MLAVVSYAVRVPHRRGVSAVSEARGAVSRPHSEGRLSEGERWVLLERGERGEGESEGGVEGGEDARAAA